LKYDDGLLKGLRLTKDEASLFPSEKISPSLGRGFTVDSIIVNLYQVNQNKCPFLLADNTCKIYEKRPTACRMFPLMWSTGPITRTARGEDCRFISKTMSELGYEATDVFTRSSFICKICWDAHDKQMALTKLRVFDTLGSGMNMYTFDLNKNEWETVA